MSIQTETSRIQYAGNNSTITLYPIPFLFFADADIGVVVTDSAGVETVLALTTDFTLTGAGNEAGGDMATVAAVPTTSTVTIFRDVEVTQELDYAEQGQFPAEQHEQGLDKLTMIAQELQRLGERAFRVSEASGPMVEFESFDANEAGVLGFSGGDTVVYTPTELATFLDLPETIIDKPMKSWLNDAARALAVPDFVGQVGVQTDADAEEALYRADGLTAGDWEQFLLMTPTERTKLSGIETAATADLTGAEITALIDGSIGDAWRIGVEVVHVEDQKSTANPGGAAATTTWNVRDLNTLVTDDTGEASLSSNRITLPAGTYECWIKAPAHDVNGHRVKLYNYTDSADEILGGNSRSASGDDTQTNAICAGVFTIASAKAFEIRHYTQISTSATTELGVATFDGGVETYTQAVFRRKAGTGSGGLIATALQPSDIGVTVQAQDVLLESISDLSFTGNAEMALVVNAAGTGFELTTALGGGDMRAVTYDAAGVSEQLVGLTASQTLTNKSLTAPIFTAPVLGTIASGVATNLTGTASGLTSGVTLQNANSTGDVTSVGNATTIAAGVVDVSMLSNGTDGELITWSAAGEATTVPVGTAGHVLTSGGAGVAPTFQTAAGVGDVVGPASATDNALPLWDGTTGGLLSDSTLTFASDTLTHTGTNFYIYPNGGTGGNIRLGSTFAQLKSPDGTDRVHASDGQVYFMNNNAISLEVNDSGLQLGAANARVTTIIDDDTMATATATTLSTSESIQAYADLMLPLSDAASNANALGASLIGIEDSAGDYTATTVEAALAEVKVIADAGGGTGAFSDASDPVVLNTTTKDVVIGTAQVNSSKLTIDGDADQEQLAIQAHSTQTAPIATIEDSSGGVLFCVEGDGAVDIIHTSTEADDRALEIDCDAAGNGDVKAIDVAYVTGAIAAGEDEAAILINVDESAATGGTVSGLEMLATPGNADNINAVFAGALVAPIEQESGTFANPTTGTNNTTATDVAAMIDGSTGTNTTTWVADNDYILIGAAAPFTEIAFIMQTPAVNPGIKPTFGYSTSGAHQFTTFTPVDGTNGFRNNGVVAWEAGDLTGHTTNDDTGTYDIKITRTHNSVGSVSLYYAQTAATVVYSWDATGAITALTVAADLSGSTDYEGTAIASTGEAGGSKFLREDGDGTCSWQTIAGGGDALVANPLSQFAATTSAQLAGVLSDETGSGAAVFATSPTLVTPALGTIASGVATNLTGTASGLTAGNVTTNANLTGDVTSVGNATTIAAGAVDVAMLTTGTDGELITWDASGNPATVAVGTSGHVLTSGGAGVAPTFQAAAGGGNAVSYKKLAAEFSTTSLSYVDVDNGSGDDLAFTLAANTNYVLKIRGEQKSNTATNAPEFAINGPTSPTSVGAWFLMGSSATTVIDQYYHSGYDEAVTGVNGSTLYVPFAVDALIENGANTGDLILRIRNEIAGTMYISDNTWASLTIVE